MDHFETNLRTQLIICLGQDIGRRYRYFTLYICVETGVSNRQFCKRTSTLVVNEARYNANSLVVNVITWREVMQTKDWAGESVRVSIRVRVVYILYEPYIKD